jgi:hypothetical protein
MDRHRKIIYQRLHQQSCNHVIVHCACKQKSEISVQKIVKGKPETATCNWHKDAVADVATGLPLLKKVGQFNEV